MRIFQLKHTKAESANNILWKLFNSEERQIRMVADPRTNSIFVSADPRSMEEIKTVLSKIDVPEEKLDPANTNK